MQHNRDQILSHHVIQANQVYSLIILLNDFSVRRIVFGASRSATAKCLTPTPASPPILVGSVRIARWSVVS